ncbi:substrate-binding domain-containing protein [Sinorhizobium medicae]|uniref:substrate-binding domain-containing protein n=1 Tax=Sinorhizobium medicae TaxID=110321 RepID=UPI002AF6CC32|nr:substrate-binding domain-containing protein [Sinorhizobium medicae]WQO93347.1 substrate-binding domain-containing protein [Sinorhizobium medicae]
MIIEAIAEVTSIGKPVITLVSDVPTAPRLNYVGINHYNAGRAAAFFLSKMTNEGRVVLLCGSLHYRAHAERISGFRDGIADYSGRLAIVDLIEARGDDAAAEYMLCKALTEGEVAGIYNAGASDAAVERAISTMNRQLAPVLVGHDLTENAARMLQNGVMGSGHRPESGSAGAKGTAHSGCAFRDLQRGPGKSDRAFHHSCQRQYLIRSTDH